MIDKYPAICPSCETQLLIMHHCTVPDCTWATCRVCKKTFDLMSDKYFDWKK